MKKFLLFAAALALPLFVSAAEKIGDDAPEIKNLNVVQVSSDSAGKNDDAIKKGSNVVLQYKPGTVYVVEFWATWCPPCKMSIPHLDAIQKKYGDQVVVIGITNEEPSKVKSFIKAQKAMSYTVAIDTKGNANKAFMVPFKARGIPNAFIIGKDGKILWNGHPMAGMDAELAKAVAAPAPDSNAPKKPESVKQLDTLKLQLEG